MADSLLPVKAPAGNGSSSLAGSSRAPSPPPPPASHLAAAQAGLAELWRRIKLEFAVELPILRTKWRTLLLCAAAQYAHGAAAQLAHRRHMPAAAPLRDAGFEALPFISADWLSEALFGVLFVAFLAWSASPFWAPPRSVPFYSVTLYARTLTALTVCQLLRCGAFLATGLPGPAPHCRAGVATATRPPPAHWWGHALVDVARQAGHGCGDLIFSSHTTFALSGALAFTLHAAFCPPARAAAASAGADPAPASPPPGPLSPARRGRTARLAGVWGAVLLLSVLIIASHKHYSVDVLVAWWTVPLVWLTLERRWSTGRAATSAAAAATPAEATSAPGIAWRDVTAAPGIAWRDATAAPGVAWRDMGKAAAGAPAAAVATSDTKNKKEEAEESAPPDLGGLGAALSPAPALAEEVETEGEPAVAPSRAAGDLPEAEEDASPVQKLAGEAVGAALSAADDGPPAGSLPPPAPKKAVGAPLEEESGAEAAVGALPGLTKGAAAGPTPMAEPARSSPASVFVPPTGLGDPVAFFPLNEGTGTKVATYPGGGLVGKFNTSTVRWTPDPLFGKALTCARNAKDLVILDPIEYGTKGPFSVSLWVKADPADTTGDTFGYPFSHSALATPQAPSPTDPFHSPGVHILVPDAAHPARGHVRAVVHDTDDPDGQAFLDSDGRYGDNAARPAAAAPGKKGGGAPDPMDGAWHAVTLTSRPDRGDGYLMYLDGQLAGSMPPAAADVARNATLIVGGGSPLGVSRGSIFLCGRSDGAPDRHFSGSVSHLAAWDRALSPDEVGALFNSVPVAAVTGKGVPLGGGGRVGWGAQAAGGRLAPFEVGAGGAQNAFVTTAGGKASPGGLGGPTKAAMGGKAGAPLPAAVAAPGASASPTTVTLDGTPCAFPFAFAGGLHYECVTAGGDGGGAARAGGPATAQPAALPAFCTDVAGRFAQCSTELSAQLGALRSWLDQYAGAAVPGDAAGGDARAGGARLQAGADGHATLCSLSGSALTLEADAFCGPGFVCAPLHAAQVARLGPFRAQLAEMGLKDGDAGVCASTAGVAWPLGGAEGPSPVPAPLAYLPLANYSTTSWPVPEYAAWNLSATARTPWVGDATFGAVLECSTAADAGIVVSHVPWGVGGAWAVNLWVKQDPGAPADAEFQYVLSARNPAAPPLDDTSIFYPDQVHLYLPSPGHPAAGTVRAIVKDVTDAYGGRASRSFLDSDGAVGSNKPRATGRVDFRDGAWHMVTLSSRPAGGKGFDLYVDGARRAGLGPESTVADYFSVGGGAPLNLGSDIVLCGRSDSATARFFDGRVSQLSLFDKGLQPSAVAALYTAVTGRAPPRAGTSGSAGAAGEATRAAAEDAQRLDALDASAAPGGGSGTGAPPSMDAPPSPSPPDLTAAGEGVPQRKRAALPLGGAVVAGLCAVGVTAGVVGVGVLVAWKRRGGGRKWSREALDGEFPSSPSAPGVPGVQLGGPGQGGSGGGGEGGKFAAGGATSLSVTAV